MNKHPPVSPPSWEEGVGRRGSTIEKLVIQIATQLSLVRFLVIRITTNLEKD
ncbi:hypothetical protein THF5H11_30416 [Vibrio jasicida]|nr:hypothetical protein THF5H11_30416 [Vibrio jasicida]